MLINISTKIKTIKQCHKKNKVNTVQCQLQYIYNKMINIYLLIE